MNLCPSCFLEVEDMRRETRCEACSSPLHKDCAIKDNGMYCDTCYTVKEEEGESIDFTIPDVIRRSYIETYRSCPYKFYLEVIKEQPQPPTIYTQLGIDLHELFDEATNHREFLREGMLERFEKIWYTYPPSLFESEEQKAKMYQRGIDSIDTFYTILPTLPPVLTTEETIIFDIGEDLPNVSITMDLITESDGKLDMFDWKTGSVMVGKKLSSDLQAPLYIYAVRERFKKPVQSFTFYYLQENKVRKFERINDDQYICTVNKREYLISLTDAIREVKSIFSHIKKGSFNIPRDTKGMHFTCKMCHFKASGTCQGADQEAWLQYNK